MKELEERAWEMAVRGRHERLTFLGGRPGSEMEPETFSIPSPPTRVLPTASPHSPTHPPVFFFADSICVFIVMRGRICLHSWPIQHIYV